MFLLSQNASQQHLEEAREQLLQRSISFATAASAPSQQQQQATVVSRDDERSTGGFTFERVKPSAITRSVTPTNVFKSYLYFKILKSWASLTRVGFFCSFK